jgi:hypothetical protein
MFAAARFITAVILIWTTSLQWPHYNYYIVIRAIVCAVTIWGAIAAFRIKDYAWLSTFAIIAILFNPILIIHLTKTIWMPINIVTGIALLISLDPKIFGLSQAAQIPDNEPKDA